MDNNRFITSGKTLTDLEIENNLRPLSIDEYIGQDKIKSNINVYIQAAKKEKNL